MVKARTAVPAALDAARGRARWMELGLTTAVFIGIYTVLVNVLHLDLIFDRTTAAGGDMGSHHYIAEFLRTDLLPRGRVTGWAPGWYAGIPMLTFYFPLPYSLIAFLSTVVGSQIAFKLVTASGLFLLPLTSWGAFKVLRLPQPAPILAALASLPFLFMTSYTIWGGNIASTMAGEFSFALSFALLPLTIAVCWRAVEEGIWWKRATLLVTALVLSHILTTIILVLTVVVLLIQPTRRQFLVALGRLARIFGVAFCLTAFWALPFILRIQYTAHFQWTQETNLNNLAPTELRPWLVFTIIGVVAAVRRLERRVLLFAWPAAISVLAFAGLALFKRWQEAPLWNARLMPALYLFCLLLAAYGATVVIGWIVRQAQFHALIPVRVGYPAVVGLTLVAILAAVLAPVWDKKSVVSDWARYNYTGYEAKTVAGGKAGMSWLDAQALFKTLDGLPEGRVLWEFHQDYEDLGTTRTLENVPVFSKQPTMEGLLIESSLNSPFHFILQDETTHRDAEGESGPTHAVPGLDFYPDSNLTIAEKFPTGLRHMHIFGVRYYVAYTDAARQAAQDAGLRQVATSGTDPSSPDGARARWVIFEAGDGSLVEVPRNRPVLFDDPHWRENSLTWFTTQAWLDTPLAYASRDDEAARKAFADPGQLPVRQLPQEPLERPGPIANARMVGNERLEFHTDQVGVPHVVKVSWFPNWRAEGAEGPWMLSPGLMVVVPTSEDVVLSYRDTPVELAGKALTAGGLLALLLSTVFLVTRRARRASDTPRLPKVSLGRRPR